MIVVSGRPTITTPTGRNATRGVVMRATACRCILRGDAHLPGTRGHLWAHIGRRRIALSRCRYCS